MGLSETYSPLVDEVSRVQKPAEIERSRLSILGFLDRVGRAVVGLYHNIGATLYGLMAMTGAIVYAAYQVIRHPSHFRLTSLVHHIEYVCWRAVPIILIVTFLVGSIISQQGIFHFSKFGAGIFVVDMLGVLTLRELGVLIVAIMIAGRSGSSYTAELGSMKMREEIDALRTMGFDPTEVLIVPRLLALIIALPMLTFLGVIAALVRRRPRRLAVWRPAAGCVSRPAARSDHHRPLHRRHGQGAVHGVRDRHHRLRAGTGGGRLGRVARPAHDRIRRAIDLLRHRARRPVRDLLRLDRTLMMAAANDHIIRVSDLTVGFGDRLILDRLNLDVRRGEVLGFVGPSGAGKSVLMRTIIGLMPKRAGRIEVMGVDLGAVGDDARRDVERRWGILFQQGALFSSLTVRQNIQFPIREYLDVSQRLLDEITFAKLSMVGLKQEAIDLYPSELSGGMIKRVGLARALALDPEIVFLDEPTAGLDPIGAAAFDDLVRTLQQTLGLTVFMVTHDLDTLYTSCDRIAVLGDRKVIAIGTTKDMEASQHPWLKSYFHGKRGRAAAG